MGYVWLTDLDAALTAGGVPYVEVGPSAADYTDSPDWRSRGRPASTGPFEPAGVLCHHTASPAGTSDEADINAILWGNSSAPGPISQLYCGRSGVVHIIAAGRANHGGQGIRPGIDSQCEDMNGALIGIEGGNSGVGEFWPDAQIEAYAALVAALCDWYGWPLEAVYLHGQTGPPGGGCNSKIDPAGPWAGQPELVGSTMWNVDLWRAVCGSRASAPITPPPLPSTRRQSTMADFVVIYGIPDVADGTVLELVHGTKRYVSSDEWWQVLKGVVAGPDGVVPHHEPWQPVATFTNGWYALGLPDHDAATSQAVPTLAAGGPPA